MKRSVFSVLAAVWPWHAAGRVGNTRPPSNLVLGIFDLHCPLDNSSPKNRESRNEFLFMVAQTLNSTSAFLSSSAEHRPNLKRSISVTHFAVGLAPLASWAMVAADLLPRRIFANCGGGFGARFLASTLIVVSQNLLR